MVAACCNEETVRKGEEISRKATVITQEAPESFDDFLFQRTLDLSDKLYHVVNAGRNSFEACDAGLAPVGAQEDNRFGRRKL